MATRYRLKQQQLSSELAKKRYSQNRWASELGLGRGHLSLLVNGKRPYPSDDTRRKLLEGLGVPFSTLFEIEDVPMPGSTRPRHLAWIPRAVRSSETPLMNNPVRDIRLAVRTLRRQPLFATVVVLVLALGIGANTAMFSWLNGVLFDLLRVEDPDRYTQVFVRWPSFERASFSVPNYRDHAELDASDIDELFAYRMTFVSAALDGPPERALGGLVSGNYFQALDARAARGRLFGPQDDLVPGRDAVAVLSHEYWQRRFSGDPAAVGRVVQVNGHPFVIVGILPAEFGFARLEPAVDMYLPLAMVETVRPGSSADDRGNGFLLVYARMAPGVTIETARAQLETQHESLVALYPDALEGSGVTVVDAASSGLGENFDLIAGAMWVLMAMVGFVLLIACANVANLQLARAAGRAREVGIRTAIGAARRQILQQLFTESLVLAALGGAGGVGVALLINRTILGFQPPLPIPFVFRIGLDMQVLVFTFAVSALTAVAFGVVPALRACRIDVVDSLRGGDGRVSSRGRLGAVLVTAQVALSLVLLIGASLFVRSLGNASSIDVGFQSDGVLLATVDPGLQGYSRDEQLVFYRTLIERVQALPGVESVATADQLPMSLGTQQWGVIIDGYEPRADERMNIDYNFVSPGYFDTLGMSLLDGRDFDWNDTADGAGAIIVNESFAQRFWPDANPLGRALRTAGMDRVVVGVARDAKYYSVGEDALPFMYIPYMQNGNSGMALHVRVDGSPTGLVPSIREVVRDLDASLPIFDVRSLEAQMSLALLPARLTATLLGVFGVFALLLAAVGLYGAMAYSVGQRTREIGIRMALGAVRGDLLRMILYQAAVILVVGSLAGLLGGAAIGRLAEGLLYGVSWLDLPSYTLATIVIATAVIAAAFLPARRAASIDPVDALRAE